MATRTVKVSEILEAIEKNGYKHVRGQWFHSDMTNEGIITKGACIMGQAAINLGISPDFYRELDAVTGGLGSKMIDYNDSPLESGRYRKYSELKEIARNKFRPYLNEIITVEDSKYNAVRKENL